MNLVRFALVILAIAGLTGCLGEVSLTEYLGTGKQNKEIYQVELLDDKGNVVHLFTDVAPGHVLIDSNRGLHIHTLSDEDFSSDRWRLTRVN